MIAPPIGRPIKVRKSCRIRALKESPNRFTTRIPIARRRPQLLCRARPTAAQAHAVPTIDMRRMEKVRPICWNPIWASGFKRHTTSRLLPGTSNSRVVTAQAIAPKLKNPTRSFIQIDKRRDMERFYDDGE